MSDHPYRHQGPIAFWSRSVAKGFSAAAVAEASNPCYLQADDQVISAGSCFASNMIPWLEAAGVTYVRTESVAHPLLERLPENLGYRKFSAAYGNIYSARHLRQLLERAYGLFAPAEDRWYDGDHVIDPFRPGLRYPASSDVEFDLLTAQHLAAVRAAFETATVLVFTLGLTEAWESAIDGAVFPACPGTAGGEFDPQRHRFINFTAAEVRDDLLAALRLARTHNPRLRVILTVSPVPLVATATTEHVLVATTYSKSVLRVAAGEVETAEPYVSYFPAYELITGPQAPYEFFEPDRREVTPAAVELAMTALFENSALGPNEHRPPTDPGSPKPATRSARADLSRLISEAECDEVLAEF